MIVIKTGVTFDVNENTVAVTHINSSKLLAPVIIEGADNLDEISIFQGASDDGYVDPDDLTIRVNGCDDSLRFKRFESGDVRISKFIVEEDGTSRWKFVRFDVCT